MLADAAHGENVAVFENSRDFLCGRFEWLRLVAQPYGFDYVTGNALGETSGNGFYFRQFGHALLVYKVSLAD